MTEDLGGTAVRTGNTVTLNQANDAFVRNLTFTVNGNALQADQTFGGDRVVVVLTRQ